MYKGNSDLSQKPLSSKTSRFYYDFTTNDFRILPHFAKNRSFRPILSKTKEPHSNRQNAAFYALLQQFEKGILYDKNNVHLPRQYLQKPYGGIYIKGYG